MSTKKVFDDMYLFLKEVNKEYLNSINKKKEVDQSNGMPKSSYQEITSRFWNLIYKEPYNIEPIKNKSGSSSKKLSESLDD